MVDEFFITDLKNGQEIACPTCGRFSKIYSRSINSSMAEVLVKLYLAGGALDYLHISEFMNNSSVGRDFGIARYWGLVERETNTDSTAKRTTGKWKLLEKGVLFVTDMITVEKYVSIFDDTVYGRSQEQVRIGDCFKNKFDYQKLMKGLNNATTN